MKKQIIIVLASIIVVGGIVFILNKLGTGNVPSNTEEKIVIDSNYVYLDKNIWDFKKWSLGVYLNTKADIQNDIDIMETQDSYLGSLDSKALKLLRDSVLSLCKSAKYAITINKKCNMLKAILKDTISTYYPEKKQALDSIKSLLKVYSTIGGAYQYAKHKEYNKQTSNYYHSILPRYKENRVKKWGNTDFEKNINYALGNLKVPKAYDVGFETLVPSCKTLSDCDSKFKKNSFYSDKCKTAVIQRVQDSIRRAEAQSMNTSN